MKQLVYHIIVCGMAVLFLTACEKDDDISGRSMKRTVIASFLIYRRRHCL